MISFQNTFISNIASEAGGAIYGQYLFIKSTGDNFYLNSVSAATGDVGQNIFLYGSVLELKCKSLIPETALVGTLTLDKCN